MRQNLRLIPVCTGIIINDTRKAPLLYFAPDLAIPDDGLRLGGVPVVSHRSLRSEAALEEYDQPLDVCGVVKLSLPLSR